jgi:potassium-transporting ATPase KdpC subunit
VSAPETAAAPPPGRPSAHSALGHLRATAALIALLVLVTGVIYPVVVTGIAELTDPSAANGSLLYYPNGTLAGSSLVAQNTDAPYLFWERPSLTDYVTTLGIGTDPGPTDPALVALLNETIAYLRLDGNIAANISLPLWWVAPSASSTDPDLVVPAVTVQIPRIAAAVNNSTVQNHCQQAFGTGVVVTCLLDLVNKHITEPPLPDIGVPYVDVLVLDLALLPIIAR